MQRFLQGFSQHRALQFGFASLIATAAAIATPFVTPAASAQSFAFADELELTDEQRNDVQVIFQDLRDDVDDILTEDQQNQLRTAFQEFQNMRAAMGEVDNLTDEQIDALRAAQQDTRAAMAEVLTDEQKAELRQLMRERRGDRGSRGNRYGRR